MPPMIHDGIRRVGNVARPFILLNICKVISDATSLKHCVRSTLLIFDNRRLNLEFYVIFPFITIFIIIT